MTRLLRSLNHQSKETQEAIQAMESWIASCDHHRSAETELLDRDIAIRTKLNLVDQAERVRISPTPQLDNLFSQFNEEPTPQANHQNQVRPPPQLNFEDSSSEHETDPDTPSIRIHRQVKTSRRPRQSPDFASDQKASVFRCIPTQMSTKTPKSRNKTENSSKSTRLKVNVPQMDAPTQNDDIPFISNPQTALEEMIVQRRQAGKLSRPDVSTTPDFPNDNSILAQLAREQHAKKKRTKKPNVSVPITMDQSFSSTDEDNLLTGRLPKIADIRTSYHLPTQYNLLPAVNHTAMVSSHAAK